MYYTLLYSTRHEEGHVEGSLRKFWQSHLIQWEHDNYSLGYLVFVIPSDEPRQMVQEKL